MNTALAAATVVRDRCNRQHVTHRSNQQVRAEEVFSYSRIPQNPHTLPTATTFEFCWEKSMSENFSWRDDRNKSSSRRTAGGTKREVDMQLMLCLNHEKKMLFSKSSIKTHSQKCLVILPVLSQHLENWTIRRVQKNSKKQTKKTLSYF